MSPRLREKALLRLNPGILAPLNEPASSKLFAHMVVPLCFSQSLFVLGRELWPVDRQRQLVEIAGEAERHLVVV
jgi:hypothetical protein